MAEWNTPLINSVEKHLAIDKVIPITADVTYGADVAIQVLNGGGFSIAAGKTLTINGDLIAGGYQIFFGAGAANVQGLHEARGMWWGGANIPAGIVVERAEDFVIGSVSFKAGGAVDIPDLILSSPWVDVRHGDLDTAAALAIANGRALVITQEVVISADTDLSNVPQIIIIKGGSFNISGGVTLTLPADFSAGLGQVFTGNGAVAGLTEARPEWWTTNVAPGTTDMTTALSKALLSAQKVKGLHGTVYGISGGIIIPGGRTLELEGATIRRIAGTLNGGPSTYMLKVDSVSGVIVRNVIIDGNKDVDALVATTESHRFGGLVFANCSTCRAESVTVTGTVNAEDTAAIYVDASQGTVLKDITGYSNDRSAVYFHNSDGCSIDGGLFYNNLGSGITSYNANDCHYLNIVAHDNGYSQVSANGLNSIVCNVTTYNGASGYSGVNIGHDAVNNRSDNSQVSNVVTYNNAGWGLTVAGSTNVSLDNINSFGNTNLNIQIFSNSTKCRLNNVSVTGGTSNGIGLLSGLGHQLNNVTASGNGLSGLKVDTGINGVQICNSKFYNNGAITSGNSAGILLNACTGAQISNAEFYDDQGTPTQESGLWVAGGGSHTITGIYAHGNKTYQYRETSSPTGMTYRSLKIGSDALQGAFTAANNTATTVTNNNARVISRIKVWPTNSGAAAKVPFVSSLVAGASFTVTFPSVMAGAETYAYEIE